MDLMKIGGYGTKLMYLLRTRGLFKTLRRVYFKFRQQCWIKKGGLPIRNKYFQGWWRSGAVGTLRFRCNICGNYCTTRLKNLEREEPSCPGCGSSVRYRAIVHALSIELLGESLVLCDFPERYDLKGLGMSDCESYASVLRRKFNYINTFYHKEPRLDITSIDKTQAASADFIISSEILEHVPPPVFISVENLRRLLKPGGVIILTVPYSQDDTLKEHFPDLYQYAIIKEPFGWQLRNITRGGQIQVFNTLVFHDGPGSTLEMRSFSEKALRDELSRAGFESLTFYTESYPDYGIIWKKGQSVPVAARLQCPCE